MQQIAPDAQVRLPRLRYRFAIGPVDWEKPSRSVSR